MVTIATGEAGRQSLQIAKQEGQEILLSVDDLSIDFTTVDGRVRILTEVSLQVKRGEVVGIVGESGSGKTTLGLAIMGLLDSPPAEMVRGG